MNNVKFKSVVFYVDSAYLNTFHDWDTKRRFPKHDPLWIERISDRAWDAYNETYDSQDSFRAYLEENKHGPIFDECVDGITLTTADSIIDRILCRVNDALYRENYDETVRRAAEDRALRALNSALDRVMAGETHCATLTFVDDGDNQHVTTVRISGSNDFHDLTDAVKKIYGRGWYRRWYDENKARGLIDFPFTFPSANTKPRSETLADKTFGEVSGMYGEYRSAGGEMSFQEWLDEKIEVENA